MRAINRFLRGAYLKVLWHLYNHSALAEAWKAGCAHGFELKTLELRGYTLGLEQRIQHVMAQRARELAAAYALGLEEGQKLAVGAAQVLSRRLN